MPAKLSGIPTLFGMERVFGVTLKGVKAYSRKEAVRMDVQYGEQYMSEVKSNGDTRFRIRVGSEMKTERIRGLSMDSI